MGTVYKKKNLKFFEWNFVLYFGCTLASQKGPKFKTVPKWYESII